MAHQAKQVRLELQDLLDPRAEAEQELPACPEPTVCQVEWVPRVQPGLRAFLDFQAPLALMDLRAFRAPFRTAVEIYCVPPSAPQVLQALLGCQDSRGIRAIKETKVNLEKMERRETLVPQVLQVSQAPLVCRGLAV